MEKYGKLIIRIALFIVFSWFGINQLLNPIAWSTLIPKFLPSNIYLIYINAFIDLTLGILILLGGYLKIVSIIGFLHVFSISFFVLGLNSPDGIRDLGLSLVTLSLFFFSKK